MAKKLTFRGRTEEELAKLTREEFLGLVKSRARRAVRRASPPYRKLIDKVNKLKKQGKLEKGKVVKTQVRDAVILPEWLGITFGVYNGKEYKNVVIGPEKLGRRLGEFSHSTGPVKHSGPGVGATRGSKFVPLK